MKPLLPRRYRVNAAVGDPSRSLSLLPTSVILSILQVLILSFGNSLVLAALAFPSWFIIVKKEKKLSLRV